MEQIKTHCINFLCWPTKSMKKLYDWTIIQSRKKHAKTALFGLAFAESSFFPIPPDAMLIPMVIAHRKKWWVYATLATVGSVLGGILGYYIGFAFFETIGRPIINFYGLQAGFDIVAAKYTENAFLAVFSAAFTPIPYKVFTIAGGVFTIPLHELIIASLLGRAGRFFIVAGALKVFGKKIEDVIEKYFNILSLLFLILLVGGFLAVKFLF
jgi:membrane protein YqaA with SNARE-associated domain